MAACTFFGHRECFGVDTRILRYTIKGLIDEGVDTFYVGNQGQFDGVVYSCLKQFRKDYPNIRVCVVLAYLPTEQDEDGDMEDTMYPEIEGHPKFAIDRRNRWLIDNADYCVCYVNHPWGGAYKFARRMKGLGKLVINIGSAEL